MHVEHLQRQDTCGLASSWSGRNDSNPQFRTRALSRPKPKPKPKPRAESRVPKAESRKPKAESRKPKAESRVPTAENGAEPDHPSASSSRPRCHVSQSSQSRSAGGHVSSSQRQPVVRNGTHAG